MLTNEQATAFAAEWVAAWNAHDLPRILSHYHPDIVFHSPRIAVIMGTTAAFVSGKAELERYWRTALSQITDLKFTLDRVYVGSDALTIAYTNQRGGAVAETFVFDSEHRVVESIATYA